MTTFNNEDEETLTPALYFEGEDNGFQVEVALQRYKGLGEMNAYQLWETTMNPVTRTLIRVTIEDLARAERRVNVLMGDKVESRRKWIEDNVNFTLEEATVF